MGEVNYKLVYKLRPLQENIYEKERRIADAIKIKAEAIEQFRKSVETIAGHPQRDLDFTEDLCRADGIRYHVYLKVGMKGSGKNICLFCGCNDFVDDF